jgi:hypothetical protein
LLGLLTPAKASQFTQLQALSPSGFAEFRSTLGGLFVALGLCTLLLNQPVLYLVLGIGWLATAAGRVLSIVADRGSHPRNYQATVFEAGIGFLLIAGQIG